MDRDAALQDDVIAFLADPASHGGIAPERKETHGALIFLLPERVYKLKRSVRYSFMDFSTPEKRRAACLEEVRLNRRTSDGLYLGTRPLRQTADGIRWGEIDTNPEDTADTVVVTARFESTLADTPPDAAELDALAETVARFHDAEPPIRDAEGAPAVARVQEGNLKTIGEEDACERDPLTALRDSAETALADAEPLLNARAADGAVRHCHGDLHLGNICRWRGAPTLFDCIEFNPAFAWIDTLYDLAFLLMDLDASDRREGANRVLCRYLEARPSEHSGLALLPLFLSMRAQVSAKVKFAAAHFDDGDRAVRRRENAAGFLDRAVRYLSPPMPLLIAIGGVSGSGKSTVARALAPLVGPAPGAVVARSDAIRKRLFGAARQTDRLPAEAYSPDASRQTYAAMEEICGTVLRAGHAAIADATFTHPDSRGRIEAAARAAGIPFLGLWLEIGREEAAARVRARRGDVSDATPRIVDRQFTEDWGDIGWTRIDATAPLETQIETARSAIGRCRPESLPGTEC